MVGAANGGSMEWMTWSVQRAVRTPASPPRAASKQDSSSNWPTRWRRLAPIARRTAISLARPAPARQQQVRDIGAGDQQNEAGDTEEQGQGSSGLAVQVALTDTARGQGDALGREAGHGLVAHAFLERHLDLVDDRAVGDVQRRLRVLERNAWFESTEDVDPVAASVLEAFPAGHDHPSHADRNVDLRPDPERRAMEAAGGHADDRQRGPVDDHGIPDHVAARSEPPLPEVVAEHNQRVSPGGAIVLFGEEPPDRGLDSEHAEVAPRDLHPRRAVGLAAVGKVGAEGTMRREAGEHALLALEVAEHRVAEDILGTARVVAGVRAGLGPRCAQIDQRRGLRNGQRTKQHLVEHREDGGVRSNAEGERHDRDARDQRRVEEGAKRETDL